MDSVWAAICEVVVRVPPDADLAEALPELVVAVGRRLGCAPLPEWEPLIGMAVYGPREAGPPPEHDRATVVELWNGPRGEALDRLLVAGAIRPASENGWAGRWDRAVHALALMLESVVAGSVHWLSERVDTGEFIPSVRDEVRGCGRFLAEVLVTNRCSLCAAKWEDLRLDSLATTLAHCTKFHRLDQWNGSTPLRDFLRYAAEHTKRPGPLESRVNDFRRGMLAKVVGAGRLFAGYVLRCECGGEVPLSNVCTRCGRAAGVAEPRRWWLWFEGQRRPAACRNCFDCDRYYYTDGSPCPHGHRHWSKRDFVAWVRERHGPRPPDEVEEPEGRNDFERIAQAVRERFVAGDRLDALALAVFTHGEDLTAAAQRLGYVVPSAAFQDAVHRIARTVADLFPDDVTAETNA